jgi:hypothetical protein
MKPGDLVLSRGFGRENILAIYLGEFIDPVFGRQARLYTSRGDIYLCHHDWLVIV